MKKMRLCSVYFLLFALLLTSKQQVKAQEDTAVSQEAVHYVTLTCSKTGTLS